MVDDKKSKERLKKFQTQKNPAKKWKCMRKILGTSQKVWFSSISKCALFPPSYACLTIFVPSDQRKRRLRMSNNSGKRMLMRSWPVLSLTPQRWSRSKVRHIVAHCRNFVTLFRAVRASNSFVFSWRSLDTEKVKKTHEQEVLVILQMMTEIFEHLRSMVVAKWKFREISTSKNSIGTFYTWLGKEEWQLTIVCMCM